MRHRRLSTDRFGLWMKLGRGPSGTREVQPGEALLGEALPLRREGLRLVEGAHVDVEFCGPAVTLVGKRRAAAGAEAALHTGRGGVADERLAGDRHPITLVAGEGGDRRARVLAAA